ncbi:oxygenase MpaB family protein [Nocardia sp. CA2R105]|uniref:oxygenase MpaB family protein n=1 Tax=Nocardia coffeae TaxID=2873381 RepID=UPI001CA5FA97|nr:oxygenase MpaB family protein [Nocardia coffeae]MBY8862654.1 oxygenase MpaB family protein [Nocardia coffeae]
MTAAARQWAEPEPTPPVTLTPETVREHIDGIAAFIGGAANVVMQLSHPPVGYGVVESTVDSGKASLHPVKRLRTTLTYLAVAWMGTEEDCAAYREAVNGSHRAVHSKPGAAVKYNAFDPNLQLWVAACLYWGVDDLYTRMRGPMEPTLADEFYRYSARLGTTLQMRPEMWPADRVAFQQYWEENIAKRTIDDTVRDYFNEMIDLKWLSPVPRLLFARVHRFGVTALLPQHLRDQMGMSWTAGDERRFTLLLRSISVVWTRMPAVIRAAPLNTCLSYMRLQRRFGRPLV